MTPQQLPREEREHERRNRARGTRCRLHLVLLRNLLLIPEMSSTPQLPETVFCERCNKLVPIDDCAVIDPEVSAGLPTDQAPEHIHVRKHRRCKGRIYLPGRAPVETRRHLT